MNKGVGGAIVGACVVFSLSANAALPLTWQVSNPPPTNRQLDAVAFGNGQFAAVGQAILTSPNGLHWDLRDAGTSDASQDSFHLYAASYGNGIFLAGGKEKTLTRLSTDGVNWTNGVSAVALERIFGLAFGKGIFVAVGLAGHVDESYLLTGANGIDWQSQNPPTTNELEAVTYGSNLFVAVGRRGTIITSPDGTNWSLRPFVTAASLNAVTFTGSRFIAGGEGGTVLSSDDGITWNFAAPTSFDINGLASGGGAVVAVGNYQFIGKIHASADGLTWPGSAAEFSNRLNGVTYRPDYFVAVGDNALIVRSSGAPEGGTNSWTKPTSGNWEEPYWSLGALPSISDDEVVFANSGFKALAINYATTVNYPSSLQIRNLLVDAPADSSNLLLLNYAGLATPLQISEDFTIGYSGALLSYASALNANRLFVGGNATFAEQSVATFTTLAIGSNSAPGQLNLSNAVISADRLVISGSFSGVFNQYAGSNSVGSMVLWGRGYYNLGSGTLSVTNGASVGLSFGGSDFAMIGGLARITGGLLIGQAESSSNGGTGRFLLSGGTVESDSITVENGTFSQMAGSTFVGRLVVPSTFSYGGGLGDVVLSGGSLQSGTVILGGSRTGTISQNGGVHINTNEINVDGPGPNNPAHGTYSLGAGRLETPALYVGGDFNQSGGTNRATLVSIEAGGSCSIDGGQLETSNFFVGQTFSQKHYSRVSQSGGSVIANSLTLSGRQFETGGEYDMGGGLLSVSNIDVGLNSSLGLHDRSVVQSGTFFLSGGSLFSGTGSNQLGMLSVGAGAQSRLNLPTERVTLRFRDSHNVSWSGTLLIGNWAGSLFGGGAHQIYVGTSSNGLTAAQLADVRFVDPAGLPSTTYPARILATGEVVADSGRPLLAFSRTASGMQLSWDTNGCQLLSSTNVAGPYHPVSPQPASPYNVTFGEPQRFFELGCQ